MGEVKRGYVRPLDLKNGRVDMTHGSGGRSMVQLISELFAKHLGNEYLGQGNDGAVLPAPTFNGKPGRLVMATDSPRGVAAVLSRRRHRLPFGAWHGE
jgi:hydrogenase expression/formation protein HypE